MRSASRYLLSARGTRQPGAGVSRRAARVGTAPVAAASNTDGSVDHRAPKDVIYVPRRVLPGPQPCVLLSPSQSQRKLRDQKRLSDAEGPRQPGPRSCVQALEGQRPWGRELVSCRDSSGTEA